MDGIDPWSMGGDFKCVHCEVLRSKLDVPDARTSSVFIQKYAETNIDCDSRAHAEQRHGLEQLVCRTKLNQKSIHIPGKWLTHKSWHDETVRIARHEAWIRRTRAEDQAVRMKHMGKWISHNWDRAEDLFEVSPEDTDLRSKNDLRLLERQLKTCVFP